MVVNKFTTETALKSSLFSIVAIEDETVVGLGRIIGDGGLYFYIQDLIVHPDFQNNGIGKSLMSKLTDYIETKAETGAFIGFMAAKGTAKYYEPFGFTSSDSNAPGMFQIISKSNT